MMMRDFDEGEIFIRCRKCHNAHPRSDFPTVHRVCTECAHNMNWRLPERRGRRPKNSIL